MGKMKIVLDADVLIHFAKAGYLNLLPTIFPEYDYVVLSVVYDEIKSIRHQLDNQIQYLKNIRTVKFNPNGAMMREYAELKSRFGTGESACMAYCRFTNDVIGSSNIKDIKDYCNSEGIKFLTTVDFLCHAFHKKILTKEQCDEFIQTVIKRESKLPIVDVEKYKIKEF